MKSFNIWGANGAKGELVLDKVTGGSSVQVEVVKLKVGDTLIHNEMANIVFSDNHGAILKFNDSEKMLKISKFPNVIDYIWENAGHDRLHYLYKFTSEFKDNYCE